MRVVKAGSLLACLVGSAALLAVTTRAEHPWLASWFTLLPLLAVIRILSPGKAFASGLLWGGSVFAFLAIFNAARVSLSLESFLLLSLAPAVYALLGACLTRRFGFNPLLLGFGWAGVELSLMPVGLQGGLLTAGHEIIPGTMGHVALNLVGSVCMASFIAVAGGLLVALGSHLCQEVIAQAQRQVYGASERKHLVFLVEIPAVSLLAASPIRPRDPPLH